MNDAATSAAVSTMEATLGRFTTGMQLFMEANRSTAIVAHSVQIPINGSSYFSYVGPHMVMALAMQPHVTEISYTSVDGVVLTYYRGEDGQPRAMFVNQSGGWCTQVVDPVNGRPIGHSSPAARPERLPNVTQVLAVSWVHSSVQVVVFSAPVSNATGVVSAAVPVEVLTAGSPADPAVRTYYAITDKRGGGAPTSGDDGTSGDDAYLIKAHFWGTTKCTASAIGVPKLVLRAVGPYHVACTSFDLAGVNVAIRLVVSEWSSVLVHRMGVAVVCIVCAVVAIAMVVSFLMMRALWRAGAREAALEDDLVQQKEALQQAERKSMNKSNAFARASHDIQSSLAAVAGLIEVSRPEAHGNPNLTYNLDQMDVGTNTTGLAMDAYGRRLRRRPNVGAVGVGPDPAQPTSRPSG